MRVRAIISDFGGVLTSPLLQSFLAFQDESGISLESLGLAMAAIAEARGVNPLVELETGQMTEAAFLECLGAELSRRLGHEVSLHGFGERYFTNLQPNERLIEFMRELRARGYRMAICTNNVREWEPLWRAMLPVDEIFDVVVDSGFVGVRKPDPRIYEITLERLDVAPGEALLVDDVDVNVAAAREMGLRAVCFHDNDQAIGEIEAELARAEQEDLSADARA